MRILGIIAVNWAKHFEESPTCEDILKKVTKLEVRYWLWLIACIVIALFGVNLMLAAPSGNTKQLAFGLLLAIIGCIDIAVIKIWVHIKLSMYRTLWHQQNQLNAEMEKLEVEDL